MSIDKGNTNEDVIYYDSVHGVQYPSFSGQDGQGNEAHQLYQVISTPSVIVIQPNRLIDVKQIWLPTFTNIIDSVTNVGGIIQACLTDIQLSSEEELLTIGPNPVKDYAYLHLNLKGEQELEIYVYNLTGKRIMEFNPSYSNSGKYSLKADFTNEPGGFYFVQVIENGSLITTKKLVLLK